jgi:asparagine synthetase B (glutamine-hydrolysing)
MSSYQVDETLVTANWKNEAYQSEYCLQLSSLFENVSNGLFDDDITKYGQFAAIRRIDDFFEAIRDPLGIEKLFYTEDLNGELHFAKNFSSLFLYETPIFSVPAGTHVRIGPQGTRELIKTLIPYTYTEDILTVEDIVTGKNCANVLAFRKEYELRFDAVFSLFRNLEAEGWRFFVALSGGLDSSIIANKAAQYLRHPVACTLDLGNSEDAEQSITIARHIGIEHQVFKTTEDELIETLGTAPKYCQDFRDFNVHCATLNLVLAKNIRKWIDTHDSNLKSKIIVLTGDLMNEFMCDYEGETIEGKEYYKLPRVGAKKLQSYLIGGLDTSDRELSPFRRYGLECVQPYAAVVDLYTRIPEALLKMDKSKLLVNSFLVDKTICSLIPKTKLRAQVGSRENMGILGLCHREGYTDQHYMMNLVGDTAIKENKVPIFVGRYEIEKFSV